MSLFQSYCGYRDVKECHVLAVHVITAEIGSIKFAVQRFRAVVPNPGVGTPPRDREINLRGRKVINRIGKQKKKLLCRLFV